MPKSTEPRYLYLTTTGRRTGLPREIEIWFTRRDGRYYVIAEQREHAHWVRNIRADTRVTVRVGRARFRARSRVLNARREPSRYRAVQELSRQKYGWGDGLPVELKPQP